MFVIDSPTNDRKAVEAAVFDLLSLDCDAEDFAGTQMEPFIADHENVVFLMDYKDDFRDFTAGMQLIVKLFFLAKGCEKYSSILPDRWTQEQGDDYTDTVFSVYVGVEPLDVFLGFAPYDDVIVDVDFHNDDHKYISVRLLGQDIADPSLEDKCEAAAKIFCALANKCTTRQFSIDDSPSDVVGVTIIESYWETPISVALDMLFNGRIVPCGHCSKPTYMPRRNSMPFHNKSCQQRYRETAMRLVKAGVPRAQAIKACPLIQPETICGWYDHPEMITI